MLIRRDPKTTYLNHDFFLLQRSGVRSTSTKQRSDSTDSSNSSVYYTSHNDEHLRKKVYQQEQVLKELRTKNAVYAYIVFSEFLKELASLAHEHAVATL